VLTAASETALARARTSFPLGTSRQAGPVSAAAASSGRPEIGAAAHRAAARNRHAQLNPAERPPGAPPSLGTNLVTPAPRQSDGRAREQSRRGLHQSAAAPPGPATSVKQCSVDSKNLTAGGMSSRYPAGTVRTFTRIRGRAAAQAQDLIRNAALHRQEPSAPHRLASRFNPERVRPGRLSSAASRERCDALGGRPWTCTHCVKRQYRPERGRLAHGPLPLLASINGRRPGDSRILTRAAARVPP
jgi:hypothetical protein